MFKEKVDPQIEALLDEIRGLREDLRIVLKAGGLQSTLVALMGGGRRGK